MYTASTEAFLCNVNEILTIYTHQSMQCIFLSSYQYILLPPLISNGCYSLTKQILYIGRKSNKLTLYVLSTNENVFNQLLNDTG